MAMIYLLFLAHAAYLLTIVRPYHHTIKAGKFHKMMAHAPLVVVLDAIVIVTFITTLVLLARAYFGMNDGPLPLLATWATFAAAGLCRDGKVTAIHASIYGGEKA